MDINQFLNPQEEQVIDNLIDIDDTILSQFGPATAEDLDEDNPGDPVPNISSNEALESLYKLRLHEEQQDDGNQLSYTTYCATSEFY